MHHSFELDITKLESTNFEFEEIKESVAEKITGGTVLGTFTGDYVVYNPQPEVNGSPLTDFDFVPPAII